MSNNSEQEVVNMDFSAALLLIKEGKCVRNLDWKRHEKVQVFSIQGSNDIAKLHGYGFGEYLGEPSFATTVYMLTENLDLVPWTPNQLDLFGRNWVECPPRA